MREDAPGDKRLVAYVVATPGDTLDAGDTLQRLAGQVPEYLVPSSLVILDTLPLLPNGKVDRRSLPAPAARVGAVAQRPITPPRTATETTLHRLWQQVLKSDAIGVDDNFFSLGGHSLLAMQLLSRVREALSANLTVRELFDAPTIAQLAARISEVTPAPDLALPPLRDRTAGESAPLSFAQQGLWFQDALTAAGAAYNMPYVAWLDGPLDGQVLHQALLQVVGRHDVLRSTITQPAGELVQTAHDPAQLPFEAIDLRPRPVETAGREALALAEARARQPFALAGGPLMRTALVQVADERHLLIVVQHHIVSDGWSHTVFLRDLSTAYNALIAGHQPAFPVLPVRYGDFAAWQREAWRGPRMDAHLEFWRALLEDVPPVLELPTDRPRPDRQTFRGARVPVALSADLTAKLRALGAAHRSSLFMTLLAVFYVLIQRHSGRNDFAIGVPTAGRTQTATENMVGLLLNTLVLRARLDPDTPFEGVLAAARDQTLSAFAHQDTPFETLVQALNPERSLAYSPLFQVMFALQNVPPATLALDGVTATDVTPPPATAKYDVWLSLEEQGPGIGGFLEFNTDLFDAETAGRLTRRFIALAESACATPAAPIARLDVLDAEERQLVVETWNRNDADYPAMPIHRVFEETVTLRPDAIALIEGGRVSRLAELNARANRHAHRLLALGVQPGTPVAIVASRSIDTVGAVLGVLKAGAAWVPVDPAYPAERIAFMLQDCKAPVIMTTAGHAATLAEAAATVIAIDDDAALGGYPDHDPGVADAVDAVAYIVYTSGSTGNPKGVLGTHRGAVNRFAWMWREYPFTDSDVCCHKTALSFVDSIWEIFGPLLQAVPNVIIDDATMREPFG